VRSVLKSNGNVKANEVLLGTRASLDDIVLAHLVALVVVYRTKVAAIDKEAVLGNDVAKAPRTLIGPLMISAVSPLVDGSSSDVDLCLAEKTYFYKSLSWSMPTRISRLYDSRDTWEVLGLSPRWDFDELKRKLDDPLRRDVIIDGLY